MAKNDIYKFTKIGVFKKSPKIHQKDKEPSRLAMGMTLLSPPVS
ncbi:hypothetical protein GXM_02558 [Nostoc sphaeroides CCNUC1]|uniref:Uncharacterized protein n=1 Tax=Nostoc sphaeroides CCNUC1 TaxID=2653204 RepID=A0A5P8VXC6_9NOSO|nr:hypothetical protein GXM_02558 [Nostoc sphaeroides CCNUC1]